VNELPSPDNAVPSSATSIPPSTAARARPSRGPWLGVALVGVLAVASAVIAWKADQRVATLERELVERQQDSSTQSAEARMLAKQAQQGMNDATAKVALLEARVAEVAVQRGQLEDLIQSLSRSRDENVIGDVEQAVRVALQQTAITGSAEPLVATLKQADERLARYNQPRLEGVRRAIARDLDRVKATNVTDISSLGIKLDEAVRMIDDLPLIAAVEARSRDGARDGISRTSTAGSVRAASVGATAASAAGAASAASAANAATPGAFWPNRVNDVLGEFAARVWGEARSLIRVTRIDNPEAMLVAPEQAYFLKENLKLRLLNARLALLSRQFETAQSDLQVAQGSLERFFDRGNKRTALASELVRQVAAQARHVGVPRPDDTLAALTAASAGR
jgi:uroporphyrin-3 C-methyltransferase